MSDIISKTNWSFIEKITFRFFFVYFILFILSINNEAFPIYYHYIEPILHKGFKLFVPWFGENVLHVNKIYPIHGFDTLYMYILLLILLIISIAGTIAWSLIDHKRINYQKAYYWFTLILRIYVGITLIKYGVAKIPNVQFSTPFYLTKLMQNFGEYYPMELAWTFLGYSDGYNFFIGFAEFLGGFLLLFRRTLVFGALVSLVVVSNVVAMNYFYHIPLKIISSHLFIMLIFLLAFNLKDLFKFFFMQTPLVLRRIIQPNFSKKLIKIALVIKLLIAGYAVYEYYLFTTKDDVWTNSEKYVSVLKGLYEVEEFTIKANDSSCIFKGDKWKYLMIDMNSRATIKNDNFKDIRYNLKVDTLKNRIDLKAQRDTLKFYSLTYERGDSLDFYMKGTYLKDSIFIKMKRYKNYRKKFNLTKREFNWVNKLPVNRY